MDVQGFLEELRREDGYAGQLVHVRTEAAREARYGEPERPLHGRVADWLAQAGISGLYLHQSRALDAFGRGEDVVVVTGTASGKSLCYLLPLLELLLEDPRATALLLHPTKALSQDQDRSIGRALGELGLGDARALCGVYDGDTPPARRRDLRDRGRVVLTNPDMLHASILPSHARWSSFLARLRLLVVDELHVYSGMFGTNVALLLRRLSRVLVHHGASPRLVACSATIANPGELAREVLGRPVTVVEEDGSPRGRRTFAFWCPPVERWRRARSRRSANDEAQDLMTRLLLAGVPTITFSKARVTAEMIYRYVAESLRAHAPHLERRVAAYRAGFLPEERREVEARLSSGDLLGVSTTRALELGIDVGGLDACLIVGYPGTVASFRQQAGRAGRTTRDSLVVLVGLDTAVNQYVMRHPEYVFERAVERSVVDPDNPFALMDHLWCAAAELPVSAAESDALGGAGRLALEVLARGGKLAERGGLWYHASADEPHREVSLRSSPGRNVLIQDAGTGAVIGEVGKFESISLVHPGAVYLHAGESYRVLDLDLEKGLARVEREQTDHYTQPEGGTDVNHVDLVLREKGLGTGTAFWGEVTAHFHTDYYERVGFHSVDAISEHGVEVPTLVLETTAAWVVPPESLMKELVARSLDPHAGLRGVGYATRMLLPLFVTCDTYDFSHSVGCVNAPWNALFVYERFPHGLGFTLELYDRLEEVLPAVLRHVEECACRDGCPLCTGKPLRGYTTWNVERGEASIPSKRAALAVLRGLLEGSGATAQPERLGLTDSDEALTRRLELSMARRLARNREPEILHAVEARPPAGYPPREGEGSLVKTDAEMRRERVRDLGRRLRRRELEAEAKPSPEVRRPDAPLPPDEGKTARPAGPDLGEIAAKARRLKRLRPQG